MDDLPLSNLRVLDFTHVLSGPTCTMVLGDLGAEVIKIEPPEGESSRAYGPFKNNASAYFNSVNRNKLSLCLDLKKDGAKQVVWDLLRIADVLVENFRPGTIARLGFDYESVKAVNPRIVYASISGFGQTGPYRDRPAYDLTIQAMSGLMSITGEPNSSPVRVGISIGDILAGYQAAIAILAAIAARADSAVGTRVDIAMFDAMVYALENAIARYDVEEIVPSPLGTAHPSITPFQAFRTKDRPIVIAIGNDALWKEFCTAVGRMDLHENPNYLTNELRTKHRDALALTLEETFASRTHGEWAEILDRRRLPHAPVNDIAQVVSDEQVSARNMIQEISHPSYGKMSLAGIPFKLAGTSDRIRRPAPTKGEHSRHVLETILGYTEDAIEMLVAEGAVFV